MTYLDYNGLYYDTLGTFFPLSEHESIKPSVVPPTIPNWDSTTAGGWTNHVQGFISDYTIDSLAHSFVVAKPYDFWIQNTDVPASSPLFLKQISNCWGSYLSQSNPLVQVLRLVLIQ